MAKDRKKLVHIHSNITDKQPRPEALEVGEIAVNNGISGNTDRSFLSIKNANNEVVRFSSDEQMISWTEKKEVIPFEGQVRGEDGPESTKDSGDYGSYGITNDDLLNNKSNLVIKFNQVAASNTPKSEIINGGKDIYGKLVNGTPDASKKGAGIAIDMSRYAMRGANPSFSSLTITNGTTLEGGLNVSGNTKIGNGLNVTGATNINGATKITGDTTFNGNETVNGNLTVTGDTNISGNTTIKGDTNISGNTTIDKNLTVNGDTKLQKLSATTANVTNLYATSNISGSSLTATTISGTNANITNLTANTISGGTLNVSGNTTIKGDTNISGNTTIDKNLTVNGDTNISGNTTLNKVTANTISASSISAVSISASNIYTKTEIDNKVQTMIGGAVSGYPNKAEYNPTDKNIYFKHNDTILNSMTIDATDFIKDGMIESVEVVPSGGTSYLKIVWNLDGSSGSTKDTIYLKIGDLFEADNYYTTGQTSGATEISTALASKADTATTYTKTEIDNKVQTMIDGAVSGYPNKAEYSSTDKNIYFKHNDTKLNSMTIDATDFIKDGLSKKLTWSLGTPSANTTGYNGSADATITIPSSLANLTDWNDGCLEIQGCVKASGFYQSSDRNLKENIIKPNSDKVSSANRVPILKFNYKNDESHRDVYGVVAQEVEANNLGELVYVDENGNKSVDYTSLMILKIAYLENENARLNQELFNLSKRLKKLEDKA